MKHVSWEIHSEDMLVLPEHQGFMKFAHFTSGVLLVTSMIDARHPLMIEFPHDPNGFHVSAQYFLQGNAEISLGDGLQADWEQDKASVIRADTPGFKLRVGAGQKLRHVCVAMYQHVIKEKLRGQFSAMLETLIFDDGLVNIADAMPVTPSIRETAHDLYRMHGNGGLDHMRCESLAMRFLCEAFDSYDTVIDDPGASTVSALSRSKLDAGVRALKAAIDRQPDKLPAPSEFKSAFGVGYHSLRRAFRDQRNVSIAGYTRSVLLRRARQELTDSALTIKQISFNAGYNHVGNFTRAYRREFGESPSDTRAQARPLRTL